MKTAIHEILTSITGVHTDAIRVRFEAVRAGDWVFDPHGGRHKLEAVSISPDGDLIIKREDSMGLETVVERIYHTITIVPEHGWTQTGAGYRSVYDADGERVGGEFYETCRCGQTFGSGTMGDAESADYLLRRHADEANGREFYCG